MHIYISHVVHTTEYIQANVEEADRYVVNNKYHMRFVVHWPQCIVYTSALLDTTRDCCILLDMMYLIESDDTTAKHTTADARAMIYHIIYMIMTCAHAYW